jgi:Protein of unknown function (DUF4058)
MPLLDHFTEPVDPRANWQSFYHRWANSIANTLDRTLPERFFARVEVNLGRDAGADVTEEELHELTGLNGSGGTAVQTYSPPRQTVIPANYPDESSVQIRDSRRGARLVAVIELVSPANKDRPDRRRAFAVKSLAYLQNGVGLVVIDVVTESHFNLHNEMMQVLDVDPSFLLVDDPPIYVVGYQPEEDEAQSQIVAWPRVLEIGAPLPEVPLYLRGTGCVSLDLEGTYMETRRVARVK